MVGALRQADSARREAMRKRNLKRSGVATTSVASSSHPDRSAAEHAAHTDGAACETDPSLGLGRPGPDDSPAPPAAVPGSGATHGGRDVERALAAHAAGMLAALRGLGLFPPPATDNPSVPEDPRVVLAEQFL